MKYFLRIWVKDAGYHDSLILWDSEFRANVYLDETLERMRTCGIECYGIVESKWHYNLDVPPGPSSLEK